MELSEIGNTMLRTVAYSLLVLMAMRILSNTNGPRSGL